MLVGVNVGGTFTDAVLLDAAGEVYSAKVATTPRTRRWAYWRRCAWCWPELGRRCRRWSGLRTG